MKATFLILVSVLACCSVTAYNCLADADCPNNNDCLLGCEKDNTPSTCIPTCVLPKVCTWSCRDSTTITKEITGDTQKCTAVDDACGTTGKCKHACEAPKVCDPTCGTGNICSRICQDPPTTTTTTGPESGSTRLELFTPLLILGTLTTMCFSL